MMVGNTLSLSIFERVVCAIGMRKERACGEVATVLKLPVRSGMDK